MTRNIILFTVFIIILTGTLMLAVGISAVTSRTQPT